MKILITGGGGFLGTNLAKALSAGYYPIRVFERIGRKKNNFFESVQNLEWFEGDFLNHKDVASAIKGCDIIYHLVCTTLPMTSNENPLYDIESNLLSSIRMLELAKQNGIKKIIFISSGGTVYGVPEHVPIHEGHQTNPISSYGITKLAIEKYLALYHHSGGPDYTILRLSNPYGPFQSHDADQGVIAVLMRRAIDGETVEVWGDGSVVRDYIYVDDVVDAMIRCIAYTGHEKLFNVGSGKGYSLNELIGIIQTVVGCKIERIYKKTRSCDVPTNILDPKKAQKVLGWNTSIGIAEGLNKLFEYMNKH